MAKTIRVLHFSTHDEECGIAIYQQNVVNAMGIHQHIKNEFFGISPNKLKLMSGEELNQALADLISQLKNFDILHIQHEYSFYNADQLERVIAAAKQLHKKVLVTVHTPPSAHRRGMPLTVSRGLHPRSWLHARRFNKDRETFLATYITPLQKADLIIATSQASIESFQLYGLGPEHMAVIELPVPQVDKSLKSTEVKEKLNRQSGDIILSSTGFLTENKGTLQMLKALSFLPSNYKLAIIGGSHPSGQNDSFYDQVCDTILALGLKDRVYITGYVDSDERRDALLRETDICLYPYDKAYYDYVSSAALTNAIANDLPIVAYKTKTFLEANAHIPLINFTSAAAYYELVRAITTIDRDASVKRSKQYAEAFSVEKQASRFADLYAKLQEE